MDVVEGIEMVVGRWGMVDGWVDTYSEENWWEVMVVVEMDVVAVVAAVVGMKWGWWGKLLCGWLDGGTFGFELVKFEEGDDDDDEDEDDDDDDDDDDDVDDDGALIACWTDAFAALTDACAAIISDSILFDAMLWNKLKFKRIDVIGECSKG